MIYRMEEAGNTHAKIKVIGIGGGGCNAVNRMVESNLAGIDFIAANTDMQALSNCRAPTLLQLGAEATRGLGAGGNPQVGRAAALEDEEKIRQHLEGADMVFITAGMGGGTGTGGAPVVAEIAGEMGALTIAVVTKPFVFEGRRRMQVAKNGIHDLEQLVDTLITIPNQKLLTMVERTTPLTEAFVLADEVLKNAVQGISDLITVHGLINLDFADVRAVMEGMGKSMMGTGFASGDSKALDAVKKAISSPLLDDMSIEGARGILINITGGEDLTLMETTAAADIIHEAADPNANIIFGAVVSKEYNNKVKVTIIATGFNSVSAASPKVQDNRKSQEITQDLKVITTRLKRREVTKQKVEPQPVTADTSEPRSAMAMEAAETPGRMEVAPEMESNAESSVSREMFREKAVEQYVEEETSPGVFIREETSQDVEEEPPVEEPEAENVVEHQAELALNVQNTGEEKPEEHAPARQGPARNAFGTLPVYTRRKLSEVQFKRKASVGGDTIAVETSSFHIPAFLRRKLD